MAWGWLVAVPRRLPRRGEGRRRFSTRRRMRRPRRARRSMPPAAIGTAVLAPCLCTLRRRLGTAMGVLRAAARKGMEGLGHQHEEMVQRAIDMQMLADEDPSKRPRAPFSRHTIFCSTSFKRGWQLKRALPANLLSLWPWRQSLRLCLVVFDSDEASELMGWIRQHCAAALEVGLLVVATSELPNGHWHASIAK